MNLPTLVVRFWGTPNIIKQKIETVAHTTEDNFVRISTERDVAIKVNYPTKKSFFSYRKENRHNADATFDFRCTKKSMNSLIPNTFIHSVANQSIEADKNNIHIFPRYVSVHWTEWNNTSIVFTNDILIHSPMRAAIYSPTSDYISNHDILAMEEQMCHPHYIEKFGIIFKRKKIWNHVNAYSGDWGADVFIDGKYYSEIRNGHAFTQKHRKKIDIMLAILNRLDDD